MKQRVLEWAKRFGSVIQALSLIFVGLVLYRAFPTIAGRLSADPQHFLALPALIPVAILSLLALAYGWMQLLAAPDGSTPDLKPVFWIVARTSIAKYLPGNVFHYVGRQYFAQLLGRTQLAVFSSSAGEVVIAVGASCALAGIMWLISPKPILLDHGPLLATIIVAGMFVPVLAYGAPLLLRRYSARFPWPVLVVPSLKVWLLAVLGYVLCLFLNQAIFLFSLALLQPLAISDVSEAAVIFGLSLVLGFVVPGSPGGLGIREAAIVLLATGRLDASSMLAAAVVQRLVIASAEALCYAVTFMTPPAGTPVRD